MTSGSQNDDGRGAALRRRVRNGWGASGPAPAVMVAVKRVGRDKALHYCPTCGQKRKLCQCGDDE